MQNKPLPSGQTVVDPLSILEDQNFSIVSTTSGKIFDPLLSGDLTDDQSAAYTMMSGMVNESPDVCPKCKNGMTVASISRNRQSQVNNQAVSSLGLTPSLSNQEYASVKEQVFFCEKCRVTHPMRNSV